MGHFEKSTFALKSIILLSDKIKFSTPGSFERDSGNCANWLFSNLKFFNFSKKPINKKCVETCSSSCNKGKKERCETIYKNTHKTELTRDIESLKLKKDNLKMNIANFNHSGIK